MLQNHLEGEQSFKSSLATTVCEAVTEGFRSLSDSKVPKMKWVLSESGTLMCSGMITCSSWDTLACESFLDKPATSAWLPSTPGVIKLTSWLTQRGLTDLGFHSRCRLTANKWEVLLYFNMLDFATKAEKGHSLLSGSADKFPHGSVIRVNTIFYQKAGQMPRKNTIKPFQILMHGNQVPINSEWCGTNVHKDKLVLMYTKRSYGPNMMRTSSQTCTCKLSFARLMLFVEKKHYLLYSSIKIACPCIMSLRKLCVTRAMVETVIIKSYLFVNSSNKSNSHGCANLLHD